MSDFDMSRIKAEDHLFATATLGNSRFINMRTNLPAGYLNACIFFSQIANYHPFNLYYHQEMYVDK